MAWNNSWDETSPAAGDDANLIHQYIQGDKKATRERVNEEHLASSGDDTDTWHHRENSARIGQGLLSSRPAASSDLKGCLWFATDTASVYLCDGNNWLTVGQFFSGTEKFGTVDISGTTVTKNTSTYDFTDFRAGDLFWVDGESTPYEISSITNSDSFELAHSYGTATNVNFHVARVDQRYVKSSGGKLWYPQLQTALDANNNKITSLAQGASAGEGIAYPVDTAELADNAVTAAKLAAGFSRIEWGHYQSNGDNSPKTVDLSNFSSKPEVVIIGCYIQGGSAYCGVVFTSCDMCEYIDSGGYDIAGDVTGPLIVSWDNIAFDAGDYWNAITLLASGGFTLNNNNEHFNFGPDVYLYWYLALGGV